MLCPGQLHVRGDGERRETLAQVLSLLQSADDVIDLALAVAAGAASERYLLASKECQEARTHRLVAQNQLLHSISIQGGRMLARVRARCVRLRRMDRLLS